MPQLVFKLLLDELWKLNFAQCNVWNVWIKKLKNNQKIKSTNSVWFSVDNPFKQRMLRRYEITYCWAIERWAPGLQSSFSTAHSFSTWTQPSCLVRLRVKLVRLGVKVKRVVKWRWEGEMGVSCEVWVSGTDNQDKAWLVICCSLYGPSASASLHALLFPHPFFLSRLLLTHFPQSNC